MEEKKKKILLSVKDLEVKFRVRGRILTAIRGISLDIYEHESIAIVGESGSGKSVFTKTFAGMLDSNGFISKGSLIFDDEELADTVVDYDEEARNRVRSIQQTLNENSRLELGADVYRRMIELDADKKRRETLSEEQVEQFDSKLEDLKFRRTEAFNHRQTLDTSKEKDKIREISQQIDAYDKQIKSLSAEKEHAIKENRAAVAHDAAYQKEYAKKKALLQAEHKAKCAGEIRPETEERNLLIAKEIYLSASRYEGRRQTKVMNELIARLKEAMQIGADLDNEDQRTVIFREAAPRVRYIDEEEGRLHGDCILDLARLKTSNEWTKVRGRRIATIFQDPMTSLNPIITIGKQISSIIIKHQGCSEIEARQRAVKLMKKVGIPNAENRYDDYPFQYSGGMRQRIVIAIALSCRPKLLICDEPTTALDVTIQAQILKLLKDLQKEFGYTIVFITHDLGVVANVADRVAVMYAGQIVEVGEAEEVFYDPRHPYTWALLSSLPQLAERNTKLFSISGTPPSLYNQIVGDPFAPRNPYCMKIDTLKEPPMFKVTETHYAKTWLLDPRCPKVEKPDAIKDIHGKLIRAFNI